MDPYFDDAAPAGARAGKAYADGFQQSLQRYLVQGQAASHIEGLSDDFAERMAAFLKAAPGGGISIYSGFRSFERQAELFQDAVRRYGSVEEARKWVAPPGKSQHNAGNAADLRFANDSAKQWAHQNASVYGLNFRMGHEPWHIEALDESISKTAELGDAWDGLREASIKPTTEALVSFEQVGITALQGLATALADGKLEGKELLQIMISVVQQLLQAQSAAGGLNFGGAAGGGAGGIVGGLGSLLGSLFGFEKGGIAKGGRPVPLKRFAAGGVSRSAAIFGEAGPEAAVPLPDGRSIPVTLNMPRMPRKDAAAAQRPQSVSINVNVTGANGDQHVIDLVQQGVAKGIGQYDRNMPGRVNEVMERQGRG